MEPAAQPPQEQDGAGGGEDEGRGLVQLRRAGHLRLQPGLKAANAQQDSAARPVSSPLPPSYKSSSH